MCTDTLNDAVARAEGYSDAFSVTLLATSGDDIYSPATDWRFGGPIIDREGISIRFHNGTWYAMHGDECGNTKTVSWGEYVIVGGKRYGALSYEVHRRRRVFKGKTALEAAMRAFIGHITPEYEGE